MSSVALVDNSPANPNNPNELVLCQVLKKALSDANFQNTDIGAIMFGLLDSMAADEIEAGMEYSKTSYDLAQDLINTLAVDLDNIRTDVDDDEEDEDEIPEKTPQEEAIEVLAQEEDDEDDLPVEQEDEDLEDDGDIPDESENIEDEAEETSITHAKQ